VTVTHIFWAIDPVTTAS